MPRHASDRDPGLYLELDRRQWRELRQSMPMVLNESELSQLVGLGEQVDLAEVAEVYLPLSRLIHLQVEARQRLFAATSTFLGERQRNRQVPFVIGVAGSVAVGKSTTARLLATLLTRWESHPKVDLITTDGFLLPTAELERRGIMHRKGFPESYDQRALLRFVTEVKSGRESVQAPVYSHVLYDIVPGEFHTVTQPDILIVEGLNVLQTGKALTVSDLFDFSIYVDAKTSDIEHWYISRFLQMRSGSFADPKSHFHFYSTLSDEQAMIAARDIWTSINRPNLIENILPTRPRATLVLRKDRDHSINKVRLRKL
ncbi:type I pantothenate kinase [Gordonia sp. VNK21]|uniref:type I pantothenate kinase n=1 Tax=Gordonia sp. VNK21 TaxID=3382483 RepID=UPI0038D4ED8C